MLCGWYCRYLHVNTLGVVISTALNIFKPVILSYHSYHTYTIRHVGIYNYCTLYLHTYMYFVIHNNFLSPAPLRVDKISGLFECSTNVQCSIHFNEHLPSRIRLFHVCTQLVICRLTICNMYIFHASCHKLDTHKLCC